MKRDVVIGFVETHGRFDTGALVIGLELLPRRKVSHRGVVVEEFDRDAARARKLAHTNPRGARHARTEHGIERVWATAERLLVCVSPSPSSARIVRAGRRMAASLHAPGIAAFVETPASLRMSDAARQRRSDKLRLAEQLGAEPVTLKAQGAAQETVRYAHARNVTKIVLGKPTPGRWRDFVSPSVLDEIVRSSGDIDVYVILRREDDACKGGAARARATEALAARVCRDHRDAGFATVVAWPLFVDVAAVLSVLLRDFFFVPPYDEAQKRGDEQRREDLVREGLPLLDGRSVPFVQEIRAVRKDAEHRDRGRREDDADEHPRAPPVERPGPEEQQPTEDGHGVDHDTHELQ